MAGAVCVQTVGVVREQMAGAVCIQTVGVVREQMPVQCVYKWSVQCANKWPVQRVTNASAVREQMAGAARDKYQCSARTNAGMQCANKWLDVPFLRRHCGRSGIPFRSALVFVRQAGYRAGITVHGTVRGDLNAPESPLAVHGTVSGSNPGFPGEGGGL